MTLADYICSHINADLKWYRIFRCGCVYPLSQIPESLYSNEVIDDGSNTITIK